MWKHLFGIKAITGFGLILMALLGFALAGYANISFQRLSEQYLDRISREELTQETQQAVLRLYHWQKEFAYRLQNEQPFRQAFDAGDRTLLQDWMATSFHRSFSSDSQFHLKSIVLRDLNNDIMAAAYEDFLSAYNGCPLISDEVYSSTGSDRLKPKYALCSFAGDMFAEVVVPVGTFRPLAYLHVIVYVEDGLEAEVGPAMDKPIRIINAKAETLYQSQDWPQNLQSGTKQKVISYTLFGDDNVPGLHISSIHNHKDFNRLVSETQIRLLIVTLITTLLVLFLVLLLQRLAFKPVDRIRNSVGALLNGSYAQIRPDRLPEEFTELVNVYNQMVLGLEEASAKREHAEKQLLNERDFISTTLDSITNAVLVINSRLEVKLANPAAESMLGDTLDNLKNKVLDELAIMYTNRSATHIANLRKLLKNPFQLVNLFYQKDDGDIVELEMTASPMLDKESEEVGHVLIFKDVTEDRKLRRKLNYEGRHDKLTGFLNRSALEHKFDSMVSESDYTQNQHIMVYMNLDQFKIINDTCGNYAGDQLLKQVADIIKQNVRKSDLLARLGGDEFGILFPYSQTEAATNTVNDILLYIHQNGFSWNEREFTVSASAALIAFGLAEDNYSEVLSKLNTACYLAKENGGNQCYRITKDDEKVQERHSTMGWASGINKGFAEHRFKLYAQPIVPLKRKESKRHYEILVRYEDDDGSIVRPQEFLPPAERFNLIEKIDRWVVSEVVNWMVQHPANSENVFFSINLSGRSIGSVSFHRFLKELLQTELVEPTRMCFEITETAAVQNVERSIEFIRMIKALGAKFSLDDFGTGLSSFTYLKQFPVDFLKIDGVFIRDIIHDSESYAFVRAITEVGHCLGMKVIAEFVESRNMFHMLREAKVDYLQGYTIGKPKPLEQIEPNDEVPVDLVV